VIHFYTYSLTRIADVVNEISVDNGMRASFAYSVGGDRGHR